MHNIFIVLFKFDNSAIFFLANFAKEELNPPQSPLSDVIKTIRCTLSVSLPLTISGKLSGFLILSVILSTTSCILKA